MRILILFFLISINCLAQDTVYFKTKEIKAVKVEEIGLNEIKYHSFDNLQGPMYVVSKSDIFKIKYPNGKVDTFAVAAPKIETPVVNNSPKEPPYPVQRIEIRRKKKLVYDDHTLGDKEFIGLVIKYPFPETKKIMMNDFTKVRQYKNNRIYGLGLLGAGIFMQLAGAATRSDGLRVLGFGVGVAGSVFAVISKNKARGKRVQIARMYNDWK